MKTKLPRKRVVPRHFMAMNTLSVKTRLIQRKCFIDNILIKRTLSQFSSPTVTEFREGWFNQMA